MYFPSLNKGSAFEKLASYSIGRVTKCTIMRAIKPESPNKSNIEKGMGCLVIRPITGDKDIMTALQRATLSTIGIIFVLVERRLSPC